MSLIYDLPIDAYHARPEISKSGLDDMDPPARCYALHLDPNPDWRDTLEERP